MSEANEPRFWRYRDLAELVEKAREDFEALLAAGTSWKPNRAYQVRPRDGRHVMFATRTGVYVGQRDAEGRWKDALWGKTFDDAEVTHWAELLGNPNK